MLKFTLQVSKNALKFSTIVGEKVEFPSACRIAVNFPKQHFLDKNKTNMEGFVQNAVSLQIRSLNVYCS